MSRLGRLAFKNRNEGSSAKSGIVGFAKSILNSLARRGRSSLPPGGMAGWRPGAPPIVGRALPGGGRGDVEAIPVALPRVRLPQTGNRAPSPSAIDPRHVTQAEEAAVREVAEAFDDIELIGRGSQYDDDSTAMMAKTRVVSSSNVYGYFYELETKRRGILTVTFLSEGTDGKRGPGPGPTYEYYDVPLRKYEEFARASNVSAGKAVWDYLRVRESHYEHQHRYRLVAAAGDYIPRRATKEGWKRRTLAPFGSPRQKRIPNQVWSALSRLERSQNPTMRQFAAQSRAGLASAMGFRRSTLPDRAFPNRAKANNGQRELF